MKRIRWKLEKYFNRRKKIMKFNNGNIYDGEWKNDKRNYL